MKKRMTEKQLRNLPQYRNAPQEKLDELVQGAHIEFRDEQRVQDYVKQIETEYDVSELNLNDRSALLDLAKVSIDIEDLQKVYRDSLAIENKDWNELSEINNQLKTLRADRSKIEYDLNISRRSRKSSEEVSVVDAIDHYKKLAKKMLEERLNYVYCPHCRMLLANVWFLKPDSGNSITLTCSRETCQKKFTITGSELIANKNKNLVYNDKGKLDDLVLDT